MTTHFVNLLEELQRRSLRMASLVEDMVQESCEAIFQTTDALARRVIARDAEVDAQEVEVESEVIRLMALYQPVGPDLRLLCTVLKVNNDLERIADCAVNIAERACYVERGAVGTEISDLREMCPVVQMLLRQSVLAYSSGNAEIAREVLVSDDPIDALYGHIIKHIVAHASEPPDALAARLDALSIAKNLERVADHAINIAEDVIYLRTGQIVRHQPRR
jgi:phosphate transport system protein